MPQVVTTTKAKFDAELAKKGASRPRFKDGKRFQFAVTNIQKWGSDKNDDCMLRIDHVALAEEDDLGSATRVGLTTFLTLPIINPESDTHAGPQYIDMQTANFARWLGGCYPDEYGWVEYDKTTKKNTFLGEDIDPDEADAKKIEVSEQVQKKAVEIWNLSAEELVKEFKNTAYYATMAYNKGGFGYMTNYGIEDDGNTIRDPNDMMEIPGAVAKSNGATGPARASKRGSKKKSSRRRR